jgi:purine-binding chemotaxis protein CheW
VRQLCTFQIGPFACAVDVDAVREIVRPEPPTPVPLAPEGVRGLVPVRGRLLTAFELGPRLGFPERPAPRRPVGLVFAGDCCLLVDEVGDVRDADASRFETAPPELVEGIEDLVESCYRGRRNRYLVLRAERIRP